jgi:hypothetical protein
VQDSFRTEKLPEHRILHLMFVLKALPAEAVWKDEFDRTSKKNAFTFDPALLYAATKKDAERDWKMAEKVRR